MKISQQQLIKVGELAQEMDEDQLCTLEVTNLHLGEVISLEGRWNDLLATFLIGRDGATMDLSKL